MTTKSNKTTKEQVMTTKTPHQQNLDYILQELTNQQVNTSIIKQALEICNINKQVMTISFPNLTTDDFEIYENWGIKNQALVDKWAVDFKKDYSSGRDYTPYDIKEHFLNITMNYTL